jgi:hypothetical protein
MLLQDQGEEIVWHSDSISHFPPACSELSESNNPYFLTIKYDNSCNFKILADIKRLDLHFQPDIFGVRNDDISNIGKLTNLCFLKMSFRNGDQAPKDLSFVNLKGLTNLHVLHLTGYIKDLDLSNFEDMTKLETLDLSGCQRCCEPALNSLLSKLPKLQVLKLDRCSQLFARNLPNLTQLINLGELSMISTLNNTELSTLKMKLTRLHTLNISIKLPDRFATVNLISFLG